MIVSYFSNLLFSFDQVSLNKKEPNRKRSPSKIFFYFHSGKTI